MSAATTTNAKPTVYRYFANSPQKYTVTTTIAFTATRFFKDNGVAATALQTLQPNNGYYQLFIGGQLQQSSLYTVTSRQVTLAATTAAKNIALSAPITLVTTNFAPSSTTTVAS